jgi:hypothetical protein
MTLLEIIEDMERAIAAAVIVGCAARIARTLAAVSGVMWGTPGICVSGWDLVPAL